MVAKKTSNRKSESNNDSDSELHKDRYFLRGGKAYVEVRSGDVFGPYGKETAAYQRAVKDSLSGRTVEAGTRSTLEGMRGFMRGGGTLKPTK